jgi:rSAM/selenodomain-associated transferase 2
VRLPSGIGVSAFLLRSRRHDATGCRKVKNILRTEPALSVVIPALEAARHLPATLAALGLAAGPATAARGGGPPEAAAGPQPLEVVVADGGSSDGTRAVAEAAGARVLNAPRGRGVQLAAGIAAARAPWLLLLHADTRLSPGWGKAAAAFMADPANAARAGYFRFALASEAPQARRLERAVAWRSRALGLPYGDQGLLIRSRVLADLGGVKTLPLMEDVDLVRRIGRRRLVALDADAVTSAEKWEREGWTARSARNLLCLGLWFAGVPPRVIRRLYG